MSKVDQAVGKAQKVIDELAGLMTPEDALEFYEEVETYVEEAAEGLKETVLNE